MIVLAGLAVLGLVIGPLLGVVVDRIVERERPAFVLRCAVCGTGLGAPLPVVHWSYVCPTDPSHPRRRYRLVDLLTVVSFVFIGWRFEDSFQLVPYLALFAVLAAAVVIDIEEHLLVNYLTYPAAFGMAFAILVLSSANDHADGIAPAFVGAGVFAGFLALSWLVYPAGLGFGDAKLALSLGLAIGWLTTDVLEAVAASLYAMMIGLLSGGMVGLIARRRFHRLPEDERARIEAEQPDDWYPGEFPLGPFLVLGSVVMIAVTGPGA